MSVLALNDVRLLPTPGWPTRWPQRRAAGTLAPVNMKSPGLETLIEPALRRDPVAARRLVEGLTPFIQKRVNAALSRRSAAARGRITRQEVLDMTQEVLLSLFERDGKVLRSWDRDKGRSLTSFVSLVAERQVSTILKSGKRSPWREEPTETAKLDRADAGPLPEDRVASSQLLRRLVEGLRERTSPLGLQMFEALYVAEREVAEVAQAFEMKADAVYAWRSRLRKLVRKLAAELGVEGT